MNCLNKNYTKGLESLMNSITQNSKNTKRYLPHELKTRENAVKMYRNCNDIGYVCRKYHISRSSLWRWNKKYDGTKESLEDKSHRPLSKHPSSHTDEEIKWIQDLIRRNPHITLNEIWYKLKINNLLGRTQFKILYFQPFFKYLLVVNSNSNSK